MNHPAIASQQQTCHACPDQWEGQLTDGPHFYFRYRYGWASLGIGHDQAAAVGDRHEVRLMVGDSLAGIFDSDEQRDEVFAALLAERAFREVAS